MRIDLNRGVTHRRDPASGADVYMYKDQPGVFLNAFGAEVSESLARKAGFPVKELLLERKKRELQTEAMNRIEAEFEANQKVVEPKLIDQTKDGFKLIHIGYGRHNVLAPDETKLNDRYLTREEGKHFLREIAKADAAAPPEEAEKD